FFAVDGDFVVAAHLTLDGGDGAGVVGDGLPLGDGAHHPLAGLGEGDHRRGGPAALGVGNHHRLAALHDGHTAVGGAQINSDDTGHGSYSFCSFTVGHNHPGVADHFIVHGKAHLEDLYDLVPAVFRVGDHLHGL